MDTTPGSTPARHLAVFSFQAGPRADEELPVTSPRLRIGSGAQNDLVIPDDSVSTSHALLEYDSGAWRLTDLDSTNGSFVEGVRLAPNVPTPLDYGSAVRFGGLRLHFHAVEGADPETARSTYTEPERAPALAERSTGFRLPLWVLVALILVVIAIAVGVFAWMQPGGERGIQQQPTEQVAPAPTGNPAP